MSGSSNNLIGRRVADRYCITGTIGKGGMGVVFRAIPFDDPSYEVAIKVIHRNRKIGSDDLMRFQKEAALMSQLHHPNIICFHELGIIEGEGEDGIDNGYFIVMELANGNNLKDELARDGRKDLGFFFQVGLQISQALDYTHGKNIIHRDIKPQNIIVGKAWNDKKNVLVKVLDFGVASLAEALHSSGRETSNAKGFDEVAGTPMYMPPEQTGLINAPADHRVDLYSVGCVLYEILAGRPPFAANSREKLERQHATIAPEPLTNLRPDIPPIVDEIVQRLLAKHPSDRYQTAFSLHADLHRAKSMYDIDSRKVVEFKLGLKDKLFAVSAQLPLMGRTKELQDLLDGYEQVAKPSGRSRMTVVKGGSGTGKTRLLAELRMQLAKRRVRFISGNFSKHDNSLPFNALANAFNEYLLRVLRSQAQEADEVRRKVQTMLGPMAHQIAAIVPGLQPFCAEVPELENEQGGDNDDEKFSTFAKAFSDFTRCLASNEHPVVFVFDDLHWADDKSLELIDQFFSNANTQRFYLIVSYRIGKRSTSPRFQTFLDRFSKLKRRFQEIELSPIQDETVGAITEKMLAMNTPVSIDLRDHLMQTSRGNPMYLVEILRALVATDLLSPDGEGQSWVYDVKKIQASPLQLMSVDLGLSRIQDYVESERRVLEIAAVAGLTFQFDLLGIKDDQTKPDEPEQQQKAAQNLAIVKALQRAMDEGLLTRIAEEPELRQLGKTYAFSHKRARDEVYEMIETPRLRQLHQLIGEMLEGAVTKPSEKLIFALAHHFNAAFLGAENASEGLAERCLKYNLEAGSAARGSRAWQSAEKYFENALQISDSWKNLDRPEERIMILEALADLAAVQRRHGQAIKIYRSILLKGPTSPAYGIVAAKAVTYQLIGGMVGESFRLIQEAFKNLKGISVKSDFWTEVRAWLSLIPEVLVLNPKKTRSYKLLRSLARSPNSASKLDAKHDMGRHFPAIKLLDAGAKLMLQEDSTRAIIFHYHAMNEALASAGEPADILRVMAWRAAFLGYVGFTGAAYRIFELAANVARSSGSRDAYGTIALARILTLDYVKARNEEISDHLREAIEYISPETDRLDHALALFFKSFRELQKCNFTVFYSLCQRLRDTIPTRNWLSPRMVALMLYGYLLQGSRDNVVLLGERFLKRRQQVAARSDDLFVQIINSMVAFSRGETSKARSSYFSCIQRFTVKQRGLLFPFEEDFVAIFACTFPVLFEHEYGKQLMREKESAAILPMLRTRIGKMPGQERSIPLLLNARLHDLIGGGKPARELYDQALRSAKVAGNNLVQCFGYMWFGMHLQGTGQQPRGDYLKRALAMAQKLELVTLKEHLGRTLEQLKITVARGIEHTSSKPKVDGVEGRKRLSRLVVQHLKMLSDSMQAQSSSSEFLQKSIDLLGEYYPKSRIYFIAAGEADSPGHIVAQSQKQRVQESVVGRGDQLDDELVIGYVAPYLNIRSTLFLPLSDAPWMNAASSNNTNEKKSNSLSVSASNSESEGEEHYLTGTDIPTGRIAKAPSEERNSDDLDAGANGVGESVVDLRLNSTVNASEVAGNKEFKHDGTLIVSNMSGAHGLAGDSQEFSADQPTLASGHESQRHVKNLDASSQAGVRLASSNPNQLKISALVPVRGPVENIGLIFIEHIADFEQRDSTGCRAELDSFGAQTALTYEWHSLNTGILSGTTGAVINASVSAIHQEHQAQQLRHIPIGPDSYRPGVVRLEPTSWLQLWNHGQMRVHRESGWFLGLNFGEDFYVLVFCILNGSELTREQLASMLWCHTYAMRALMTGSGQKTIEVGDIKEELAAVLRSYGPSSSLETVSLAFTVFDRKARTAASGHFGPARPLVVGVENHVTPSNEVFLRLASGRDLRYWDVTAELNRPHTYLLSYDTSKVDGIVAETIRRNLLVSAASKTQYNVANIHGILQSIVPNEMLPRFYVAAVLSLANDQKPSQHQVGLQDAS